MVSSDIKLRRFLTIPGQKNGICLTQLQSLYRHSTIPDTAVYHLPEKELCILVTGGAGFVGSHLVDRLMLMGHRVTVVDDFSTGFPNNLSQWKGNERFRLIERDVCEEFKIDCDQIYHLACPASPSQYQSIPLKTLKTCFQGTMNVLEIAKSNNAKFLLASTSEVYGDPEVHPQPESYHGSVNCTGVRACYDEGKRCSEALAYCYQREYGVDIRVARIFNTYGPRIGQYDGRVVSNFIRQALSGEPITVHGGGKQTRSFQFVHDLVTGLIALMESDYTLPVNLGNPEEYPIIEFAQLIKEMMNSESEIVFGEPVPDDPQQRRPDISAAGKVLGWRPEYTLKEGLEETIEYFKYNSHNSK